MPPIMVRCVRWCRCGRRVSGRTGTETRVSTRRRGMSSITGKSGTVAPRIARVCGV